jgi:serine/threonine-protein kinase RsbW
VTASTYSVEFRSPPDSFDLVHEMLETFWAGHPVPEDDRMAFETALIEVAGNIFEHARRPDGIAWVCTLTLDGDRLTAELRDDGSPAEISLDERPMPDDLAESGRGLPLVQALTSEFAFRRLGDQNVWTIVLLLGALPDGGWTPQEQ